MPLTTFLADTTPTSAYLALPPGNARGKAVLVLHAWWGLNEFFQTVCDRLAVHGYTAFAPDLMGGKIATTVEEATRLMEQRDFERQRTITEYALTYLQNHHRVRNEQINAMGFSMGAAYTMVLDQARPGELKRCVLFYGGSDMDFTVTTAEYLCHFAERDEWEPLENVRNIDLTRADYFIYPATGHWFFEDDRPNDYVPAAAALAWKRSLEFLGS